MFISYFPALCWISVLINLTTVFVNYTAHILRALQAQKLIQMGYSCLLNVYFFLLMHILKIFLNIFIVLYIITKYE